MRYISILRLAILQARSNLGQAECYFNTLKQMAQSVPYLSTTADIDSKIKKQYGSHWPVNLVRKIKKSKFDGKVPLLKNIFFFSYLYSSIW